VVSDIEATVAELRRRGVTIVTEPFTLEVIDRKLAFFADPWGNLIELVKRTGKLRGLFLESERMEPWDDRVDIPRSCASGRSGW